MKIRRAIKRYMAIWQAVLLLTVCFATSCYSGSGGELHPQNGEGYSVVKKADGWEAAQVISGETSVRIEGSWSETSVGNTFRIENNSAAPFNLDFAQVRIEVQRESAKTKIISIYDYSSSAAKADGETFDDGKQIYKLHGGNNEKSASAGEMKVVCPPKRKCIFSISVVFDTKLNKDKSIKVILPTLPSETKETEVIFNCRRKSIVDSLTGFVN